LDAVSCNFISWNAILDSRLELPVTQYAIVWNLEWQSAHMVTLSEATDLSDKKQADKFIISEPECLVERVVTEFVTGVHLPVNECGLLWDLEVFLEEQLRHQELVSLNCFHEWGLLRLRVTHERRDSALMKNEIGDVKVTSIAGPVQVSVGREKI